ncbi:MAG: hypothetical protein GY795_24710 [Desulfobacterales bacterium]|nr:hypothetical protein [Desulfobacterales bacterium]
MATAGGYQGKYTETRNKLEGKRQTDNKKKIDKAPNGKRLSVKERNQISNSPAGNVQRLFNCIFGKIRNITGVTSDTFKNN